MSLVPAAHRSSVAASGVAFAFIKGTLALLRAPWVARTIIYVKRDVRPTLPDLDWIEATTTWGLGAAPLTFSLPPGEGLRSSRRSAVRSRAGTPSPDAIAGKMSVSGDLGILGKEK